MISAHELRQITRKKHDIKKEMYKIIYDGFCKQMRNVAQLNKTDIILTTPIFMFGYPSYDVFKATVYLQRQLEMNGFSVVRITDDKLHVSWHSVIQKTTEVKKEEEEDVCDFPNFVNLRKVAQKYKNRA